MPSLHRESTDSLIAMKIMVTAYDKDLSEKNACSELGNSTLMVDYESFLITILVILCFQLCMLYAFSDFNVTYACYMKEYGVAY